MFNLLYVKDILHILHVLSGFVLLPFTEEKYRAKFRNDIYSTCSMQKYVKTAIIIYVFLHKSGRVRLRIFS